MLSHCVDLSNPSMFLIGITSIAYQKKKDKNDYHYLIDLTGLQIHASQTAPEVFSFFTPNPSKSQHHPTHPSLLLLLNIITKNTYSSIA